MEKEFKNKYEHFKINFKDLEIEVKLLDSDAKFPNQKEFNGFVEEFKVIMRNGEKEISYKFYNSIMEREISQALKDKSNTMLWGSYGCVLSIREFKRFMNKKMWGGYDKIKSLKELTKERIYFLLSGVLNSFELDKNTETDDFKWFCDCFGYDDDSITAEKIFNCVIDFKRQAISLNLTDKQNKYFQDHVGQETEKFNKELRNAIKE